MGRKYVIDFVEPPPVGKRIDYFGGHTLTLASVVPYTRKDGSQSFLLHWKAEDGRIGTSGLRSASLTWGQP